MPETGFPTIEILLGVCASLLLLLLLLAVRVNGRMERIERLLAGRDDAPAPEPKLSRVESTTGGTFEAFLDEDPSRRILSKKEQFAAYRLWRKEKGLNWSNS